MSASGTGATLLIDEQLLGGASQPDWRPTCNP